MVAVEQDLTFVALDDRMIPLGEKPEALVAVTGLVAFDVRLCDNDNETSCDDSSMALPSL